MPVWGEVFVSSFRNRFSHHCCEKALPPRAENVNNAGAQHSFLSVSLVNQGTVGVVRAAWCVECSLRVYQNRNQLQLRTCVLLCFFRDFFDTDAFESSRSHRQIRWRCAHKKELCGCTPAWRCPAPASFRQLLCCAEEDHFYPFHHIHVQRLERRQIRLEFSLRFPNVDHFCVHCPTRARHRNVRFHLFFIRAVPRQVKEETLADPDALPAEQLRQSVYFMASALFQRFVQLRFQRHSSSCCVLSRPSAQLPIQSQEPVPRVQVLF